MVPARQRAQAVWSLNGSIADVTTVLHLLKDTVRPSVSKLQGLGLRISVSSTHSRMKIQSAWHPHWVHGPHQCEARPLKPIGPNVSLHPTKTL